jgi:cobalt-zinc-cadmium efflux system membrane fusion protein
MKGLRLVLLAGACLGAWGCSAQEPAPVVEEKGWAVTAWGNHFEIFAEAEPLIVGRPSESHTHVTVLAGFQPLQEGVVRVILAQGAQRSVFEQATAKRPGIYGIEVVPPREGEFDLFYEIVTPGASETVPGGRVRVGTAASPGGVLQERTPASDAIPFLKEQQWRTRFATAAASKGALRESFRAPGRVRPAAGAELVLTAPVPGRVLAAPWPHVGQLVQAGRPVFRLVPRVDDGRSLAELSAQAGEAEVELATARARLERVERLLQLEAISASEVHEARSRVALLESRHAATRTDLATARSLRSGGTAGERTDVTVGGSGRVSEVRVTPGQAVEAGEVLGRVIRSGPVWLEVALSPAHVSRARGRVEGLVVHPPGRGAPITIGPDALRSVAVGPEVAAGTGTVPSLYELAKVPDLPIGARVDVDVLLPTAIEGIVVPATSVIDDGGVPVVYVQIEGESFERREVVVRARQAGEVVLEGIREAERVVVLGGDAIRRAALLSSGPVEGHVH